MAQVQKQVDYLKFNAESMKKLITRKLSENQNFTDQVFEDSNLTILIDVFAYMFETMMYYLNNSASEAIFSDTQLYENMNRIVKMIGYNPNGFITCSTQFNFYTYDELIKEGYTDAVKAIFIPKYTYVTVPNKKDASGNDVYYCLVEDKQIQTNDSGILDKDSSSNYTDNQIILYNGRWKVYERTFIAEGIPYENYELNIPFNQDEKIVTVAHPYIHIYIKRGKEYILYTPISTGTLFGTGADSIYGPIDNVFELRLNEYKRYVITFGDGIHGASLKPGDELFVIFLNSNGIDGKIVAKQITDQELKFGIDGLDTNVVKIMMASTTQDFDDQYYTYDTFTTKILCENIISSSLSNDIESVDSIRNNAPEWFKQMGRLITEGDFEFFIKKNNMSLIYDCKAMNNWTYAASFLRWLYTYSALSEEIRKEYYKYADSCDFNNVYIWIKWKIEIENYDFLDKSMLSKKCLTSEPIIVKAVDNMFVPCLVIKDSNDVNYGNPGFDTTKLGLMDDTFDSEVANFIEVLRIKDSIIPLEKIKQNVIKTIKDFFDPEINNIGGTIDLSKLYSNILSLEGVQDVKSSYLKPGELPSNVVYYNGLSFAHWSKRIIAGKDFSIEKGNIKVENFQYPVLATDVVLNLDKRVRVVAYSFSTPIIEY